MVISSDNKELRSKFDKLVNSSPRELFYYLRNKFVGGEKLLEFNDEHVCLFVLSTGRVGTATLTAMLGLAKNVFAYHEPKPLLYRLSRLSYEFSENTDVQEVLQEAFIVARQELMRRSLDYGKGYVESSPQVTFLAPYIRKAVTNVRFIHLVRDPRDVVRSGMRRNWYEGHGADKTRIIPHPDSSAGREWESYSAFKKNLWLWNETNSWILNFTSDMPKERVLLLHSEDLFGGNEESLKKLFTFIGSSLPPGRKISRVLGKKLNKQKTGIFPTSEVWSDEMQCDLFEIAGRTAQSLGYKN